MRFPEEKIKAAILHPEVEIGALAVRYFAKSFSSDLTIMPRVIEAVETYGRNHETYRLIGPSRNLPQSETTVAWVINELNDERCNNYDNYPYNLSMVLMNADTALFLPRESEVVEARHFCASFPDPLFDRLEMRSWDMATCWQELEKFCEEGKDKQFSNEINLGYAKLVVEALSRFGQECALKVREYLEVKVDDYSHHPMKWMEPLVVSLAGLARLEFTIPLIVAKLHEDADLLSGECVEALIRIGTPAVLHAIAEAFRGAEQHFRIYATGPLEHIHSDLAVETCLKLLEQESVWLIRRDLGHALLSQFDLRGIEIVRQLLLDRGQLDGEDMGLRNYLLETCTLMGERFPEYEDWSAAEEADKAEHQRRIAKFKDDPTGLLIYALEKMTGKKATDLAAAAAKPLLPAVPSFLLPSKPASKQKVGRNDPCPCKSGRKYKRCCMRE